MHLLSLYDFAIYYTNMLICYNMLVGSCFMNELLIMFTVNTARFNIQLLIRYQIFVVYFIFVYFITTYSINIVCHSFLSF